MLSRLLQEPPFRLLGKLLYRRSNMQQRVFWGAIDRAHYAAGVEYAAHEAKRLHIPEICVIEFGVARGHGLLALQSHAELAESETGVRIRVHGFDLGTGLPESEDYRDHLDKWKQGDYPMDVRWLKERLQSRTTLELGDVAETVPKWLRAQCRPIGFISFDLDLYSSTRHALRVLSEGDTLPHTPCYFDDVGMSFNHRYAGELLAIDDFNQESKGVKIDRWRGLTTAFPESYWLKQMYMAHRLETHAPSRTEQRVL